MGNMLAARSRALLLFVAVGLSVTCGAARAQLNRNFGPVNYLAELTQSIDQFKTAEAAAIKDARQVPEYVQSGLTLSNVACDGWLVSLGQTDRDTSFFKDMLNIVGNLIIGIAGINNASPSSLARGSLALGASNAALEAYRNEFLMGVISDIESKIKSGRRISESMLLENTPANYHAAKRRLLEYHDQCTPTAIKDLLKTSLAQVAYARPDTTLGREVNEARASVLSAQLYAAMYPNGQAPYTITSDDLYKLWVVKIALPGDHPSTVVKNYKAAADVVALGKTFDEKNDKGQLAPLLKQIAEYRNYAKRLEDELTKEKQEADREQEKDAKKKLDDASENAKMAETDTKNARKRLLALENNLMLADRSRDQKVRQDASALLGLLQRYPGAREGQVTDVKNALAEMQSTARNQSSTDQEIALRDSLGELSTRLDAQDIARQREEQAKRTWEQVVQNRRSSSLSTGPVSITPVIVPVRP